MYDEYKFESFAFVFHRELAYFAYVTYYSSMYSFDYDQYFIMKNNNS